MGLAHASSADVPLSELIKAHSLKATATGLTVGIVGLSQSSGEAHLDDHLSLCCLDVGCEERRKMSLVINECAIFKRDEHGLSRCDRYDHAGPVCGSAASSAVPRDHHLHMWRRLGSQGLALVASCHRLGHAAPGAGTAGSESPWDGPRRLQPLSCTTNAVSAGIHVAASGTDSDSLQICKENGGGVKVVVTLSRFELARAATGAIVSF